MYLALKFEGYIYITINIYKFDYNGEQLKRDKQNC